MPWVSTCPKCGFKNYGPTINSVSGGENHGDKCGFYVRGAETRFTAVPIQELPPGVMINKDELWDKAHNLT